ncbi:E3 ubiquitin-protein ligase TRIM33-like [Haliotis rubra]|uniref:E3 ubiquitin-protein ligase TRIM33-like n=1 Tax=Haliotis rubra TaxID=36100 RepID=UPI001EE509F8|nr:E3 ubiquitin-protein ligase TRIM33-like [Haliotis rubra]
MALTRCPAIGPMSSYKTTCRGCETTYNPPINYPRLLPCLHTTCSSCLADMTKSNHKLTCPVCGDTTDIQGVLSFPVDPVSLKTIGVLELKDYQGKINCNECPDRSSATSRCLGCRMYMCDTCKLYHERFSKYFLEQHVVVALKDLLKMPESIFNESMSCEVHLIKQTLYCERCHVAICWSCSMETHSETYVTSIIPHFDTSVRDLNDECKKIRNTLHEINSFRGHLSKQVNTLCIESNITLDEIEDNVNMVHLALERRKRLLLRHLQCDFNEELQMVAAMKAVLMSRIQTSQSALTKSASVLDVCSPAEVLTTSGILIPKITNLASQSELKCTVRRLEMRRSGLNDIETLIQGMCTVEERPKVI